MFYVLVYLALISGITPFAPFGIVNIEHFPYGILLILFLKQVRVEILYVSIVLISFYVLSILYYQADNSVKYLFQLVNLISPLFFVPGNEQKVSRIAYHVFFLYIIVGVLQKLGLIQPLEPLIQNFIPRFTASSGFDYRGVTMLESENARASFQLTFLYLTARPLNRSFKDPLLLILFLAQFFLIQSTVGILISAMLLSIMFFLNSGSIIVKGVLTPVMAVLLIYVAGTNPKLEFVYFSYMQHGVVGIYDALAASSGGRFLGHVSGVVDILSWPLGYGAEPDFLTRETHGQVIGGDGLGGGFIVVEGHRPISAILVFARVFGLWGLALLFLMIWMLVRDVRDKRFLLAPLLLATLYSPPGSEIILIATLVAADQARRAQTAEQPAAVPQAVTA